MNHLYGLLKTIHPSSKKEKDTERCKKIFMIVDINANKNSIKFAFEKIFNIKVIKINSIIVRGKFKNKKRFGKMKNYKKVIFTVYKKDSENVLI